MNRKILLVSHDVNNFSHYEKILKRMGFKDLVFTDSELDGLSMQIREIKPRLIIMDSHFYSIATPYMMGKLRKEFPDIRIVVVSIDYFPADRAVYFILSGADSYLDKREGWDEFVKGLSCIKDGIEYISPAVQEEMKNTDAEPDLDRKMSKRLRECLIGLCNGEKVTDIGRHLHITKSTVENHLQALYDIYHVYNREEMVAAAWILKLVNEDDIHFFRERHRQKSRTKKPRGKNKDNRRTA